MTRRKTCPKCGTTLVPVFYGYPPGDVMERASRGEVVLGGDVEMPGFPRPKFDCPKCDADAQNEDADDEGGAP